MRNAWPEIEVFALPSEVSSPPVGHFKGAKFEQNFHNNQYSYDILWFVWDRDGIFRIDDWEPIILFWKEIRLIGATTRPHYEWQDYSSSSLDEKCFVYPLRVIFRDTFHGCYLATTRTNSVFDEEVKVDYARLNFEPSSIDSEKVPTSARKAIIQRRGRRLGFGQDIHDKAIARLEELRQIT